MVVLLFADYAAPYEGNFISSLKHLENRIRAFGGTVIYLFPESTEKRDWAHSLKNEHKNVFFLSGSFLYNILLVRSLINNEKVDIIHTHFSVFKYDFIIKAARLLSHKTVYIRHMHMLYHNKRSVLLELLKRSISNADCEIACSKHVYNSMKNAGIKRLETVINAIDFDRLNQFEKLERADYSISQDEKIILMFGYDYITKGVDVAVKAIELLNKKGCKSALLICAAVNSEYITERIERDFGEIPSHVRIIPPKPDIASYYKLCDVFLSASRAESFCYALYEAGYCGALLVASDIEAHTAIPETVLFKSCDSIDLHDKLLYIINSDNKPDLIKAQVENLEKKFSITVWCDELLEIYKNLLTN